MSSIHSAKHFVAALAALMIPLALAIPGCGGDDEGGGSKPKTDAGTGGSGGSAGTAGTGGTSGGSGVCLLNNCACPPGDTACNPDDLCAGCSFNRTKCKVDEGRCIACDPTSGTGCGPDEECSSFGTCVPKGQTCNTDANGEPTITCTANADCKACDPMHQICDTTISKCVACTETNTSQCLPTDVCVDNKCARKCPDSCNIDNDCQRCDSGATPTKACYNHVCSQCSDTYACPSGLECKKGQCVKPCGLPGSTSGACTDDANCAGCGDPNATTNPWKCKYPLNGGNHGTCAPPATGCSDLGAGVAVLPSPYDKITNTCSNDTDCSGVGIQYNVGKAIRDLIGGSELDIGIKKIPIQDAVINYAMPKCASIKITDSLSCGLCVPCKADTDCQKIQLDPLIKDLFKGDPLASIAGAFLLDLLYGKEKDHSLHFQCLPVAAGYGVCIPCGNPTKSCTGTTTGSGKCDHDVCTAGTALDPTCGTCAAEVCKNDAFCCTNSWDSVCVSNVNKYCAAPCGGGTTGCDHGPCATGKALSPLCSPCVKAVCEKDPFCCNTTSGSWDNICVGEAQKETSCSAECSGTGCAHSECSTGGPLTSTCSACATAVCAADSYCCNTDWDSLCVTEAKKQTACSCN